MLGDEAVPREAAAGSSEGAMTIVAAILGLLAAICAAAVLLGFDITAPALLGLPGADELLEPRMIVADAAIITVLFGALCAALRLRAAGGILLSLGAIAMGLLLPLNAMTAAAIGLSALGAILTIRAALVFRQRREVAEGARLAWTEAAAKAASAAEAADRASAAWFDVKKELWSSTQFTQLEGAYNEEHVQAAVRAAKEAMAARQREADCAAAAAQHARDAGLRWSFEADNAVAIPRDESTSWSVQAESLNRDMSAFLSVRNWIICHGNAEADQNRAAAAKALATEGAAAAQAAAQRAQRAKTDGQPGWGAAAADAARKALDWMTPAAAAATQAKGASGWKRREAEHATEALAAARSAGASWSTVLYEAANAATSAAATISGEAARLEQDTKTAWAMWEAHLDSACADMAWAEEIVRKRKEYETKDLAHFSEGDRNFLKPAPLASLGAKIVIVAEEAVRIARSRGILDKPRDAWSDPFNFPLSHREIEKKLFAEASEIPIGNLDPFYIVDQVVADRERGRAWRLAWRDEEDRRLGIKRRPMEICDVRLKHNIVPLARLDNGIALYRFRYCGNDPTLYVGVMAQEVRQVVPDAVHRGYDGYLRVDYGRLGLQFMTWDEWTGVTCRTSPIAAV
jgi:hypothetical protein